MKLGAISAVDYTAMSNSTLDTAYADAFNIGDSPTYTAAGDEIVQRLATPLSALESAFGYHRFPKWDAIQASGKTTANFVATDVAQQAVVTSSGNLVTAAESALTKGAWIIGGLAALALLFRFRKKR